MHHKYPKSLGRIIYNCNSFSKNSSSNVFSCHCNEAHLKKYVNSDHWHIIMGDLNIIVFHKLKKLMKHGIKFRIPSCTSINAILKQFSYDIGFFYL